MATSSAALEPFQIQGDMTESKKRKTGASASGSNGNFPPSTLAKFKIQPRPQNPSRKLLRMEHLTLKTIGGCLHQTFAQTSAHLSPRHLGNNSSF